MEKIKFTNQLTKEDIEFFVLEQTQLNNENYLLVAEDEYGDSDAYILKETASKEEETVYEMVDDDAQLEALGKIFAELMEDIDFEF